MKNYFEIKKCTFLSLLLRRKKFFHFTFKLVCVPTYQMYLPQKSTKRKRKYAIVFYALRAWFEWLLQAKLALLHSLRDARGAKDYSSQYEGRSF